MASEEIAAPPAAAVRAERGWRWLYVVPLLLYAVGLTHELNAPWIGMHDWNGAFFSQLARNFLRYPWEIGHGMPVVAVGEAVPPPAERSIYATHPPGLVWVVAAAFRVFGEHEWAARLVPILASLGFLGLLMWLLARRQGRESALVTGLIYAVLPMAVYYGRMPDHEAVCLFGMLLALVCWEVRSAAAGRTCFGALALLGLALFGVTWIDWAGTLFVGLFIIHVLIQGWRGLVKVPVVAFVVGCAVVAIFSMLWFLAHFGLDGRWGDLVAIFTSRAGSMENPQARDPWTQFPTNLTWPVLVLALIGASLAVSRPRQPGGAAGQPAREPGSEQRATGLAVLAATGLIWVAVFWRRQFSIHGYWAFYLGPIVAAWAACGLRYLREAGRERLPPFVLLGLYGATLLVVMAVEVYGVFPFFASYSELRAEKVAAWQEVNRRTAPSDRVLLFEDPVRPEEHGGYYFRNITPPQLAYYLDRPFDVGQDLAAIPRQARDHACYLIPWPVASAAAAELAPLVEGFESEHWSTELFVDFRYPRISEIASQPAQKP